MKYFLRYLLLLPTVVWAAGNQAVLYDSYGSSDRFVIEGRVIEAKKQAAAKNDDAWYSNLWHNLRTLKNSDREGVKLTVKVSDQEAHTVSAEEGYFHVALTPQRPLPPGWHAVNVQGKGAQGVGWVLIVPKSNTLGIISDIDDTVLISDVPDKSKLLKNTFLKNPTQRQAFPGTADFYRRLLAQNSDPKATPMFYVSASPRQLAESIKTFLMENNFPQGVLVTKQINGNGHDPLLDQKEYKAAKIEAIFSALPWVKFVLVGDDGELDPETYRALQEKYPQHVAAIYIRKVSPDPKRKTYAGQLDLTMASGRQ